MQSTATGFVTDINVPFDRSTAVASELEFEFIELFMEGRFARTAIERDRETYRDLLEQNDLDLIVHLPFSLDIGSPFERVRDASVAELADCLQIASELGATKAVVHPTAAVWDKAWDASELRPLIVESISRLTETARECDIELCAENIFGTAFTLAEIDALLEATDVSMTLDTGHARITGYTGEELSSFVTEYADRISHVHLNDSRYPEDEHLPFGSGTVDFAALFDTLRQCEWGGTLSLEVHTDNLEYIRASKRNFDAVWQSVE
ncbi:sugar phosphate isomerase/epimerase family protein [Natrarchaeobius sp. A-rgal3]|uniref:sugar phosphate isomerase/epimerase family protein n=1 Tax=Natrarchaeobius versutus TaxID=1679078 RepID=UPI00350F396E